MARSSNCRYGIQLDRSLSDRSRRSSSEKQTQLYWATRLPSVTPSLTCQTGSMKSKSSVKPTWLLSWSATRLTLNPNDVSHLSKLRNSRKKTASSTSAKLQQSLAIMCTNCSKMHPSFSTLDWRKKKSRRMLRLVASLPMSVVTAILCQATMAANQAKSEGTVGILVAKVAVVLSKSSNNSNWVALMDSYKKGLPTLHNFWGKHRQEKKKNANAEPVKRINLLLQFVLPPTLSS